MSFDNEKHTHKKYKKNTGMILAEEIRISSIKNK